MQLTAIFLLAAGLTASATGFSQKVTLSEKNAPLEKVFLEIKQQTGLEFLYTDEMLEGTSPVTISLHHAELSEVLAICFKDQPITFQILEKTIVVSKREAPKAIDDLEKRIDSAIGVIKGTVLNDQGQGLSGATVMVKGSSKGTLTNEKGQFEIKNAPVNAVLQVSYLGYTRQEISAEGEKGVTIRMVVATNKLDEAQVIAYDGRTTQRFSTSVQTTIKGEDIAKQPVSNVLEALEGRVPGLFITQTSGLPGTGITLNVQGLNSLSFGTAPFYVVDGVPYPVELLPNLGLIYGTNKNNEPNGGNGNPLSYINPADIESVTVLRDADATAIYGSRAANGAILINTKKGKAGQTKVDLTAQQGIGQVTHRVPLLNTQQYLMMRHEAFANDGKTPTATDYDVNGTWDTTRNTDWQKVLLGGTAQYSDVQGNISGGTVNTQFLIGAGFHRETTVFPGNLPDQKGSLHFNINTASPNRKLNLQLSGSYLLDNSRLIQSDLTNTAILLPPDAPSIYSKDSLNWALLNGKSTWQNPLSFLNNAYNNTTKNLIANMVIAYQIFKGLDVKSSFGYNNLIANEMAISPLSAVAPESRPSTQRASTFSNTTTGTWIIEPQITYKTKVIKGTLESLVGSTVQQTNNNQQSYSARGFTSDLVMQSPGAAATITTGQGFISTYKYNALFFRLNYIWDEKYILNLAGRRDGSSRFGPQNEFKDFGSVGAAWIFSQEGFIKKNIPVLSFGKLRISYGTTGNDQIGDYGYLSLYSPQSASNPYQGASGLLPGGIPNAYLQWESTKKLQTGIDIGLAKDRILIHGNYYRNRSSNLLQGYALPSLAGHTSVTINFPATVQNTGWEFSLETKNIATRKFSWSTSINLTIAQNKLVSYPGLATSTAANSLVIGKPINIVKVYKFAGVNPNSGLYQYVDSHGNLTSTPSSSIDRYTYINPNPKFYGGISNTITYEKFELDFLLQFIERKTQQFVFGTQPGRFTSSGSASAWNQPVWILDRWQKPGDITSIQRYSVSYPSTISTPYGDASQSTGYWKDGSFIRLKNLSLAWQFPKHWLSAGRLQNGRIFLRAQNLLTFTKYKGTDPETTGLSNLPPLRVLTFGIQVGL